MSALVMVALLAAPDTMCFFPRDPEPGWKVVTVPPEAPALAAPDGVDQFRPGDTVELLSDHPGVLLSGAQYHAGRTDFEVKPGEGACQLALTFAHSLRGAKVDVTAWTDNGTTILKREDHVPGASLQLAWGDIGVHSVYVTVHNHLRETPVLEGWSSVCRIDAGKLPVSESFRLGRSLYYYQPRGPRVVLCNRPEAVLRVRAASLPAGGPPVVTALSRG
jgi:hypothetical protein